MMNSDLSTKLKSLLLEEKSFVSSTSSISKNDAVVPIDSTENPIEGSTFNETSDTTLSLAEEMLETSISAQMKVEKKQRGEEQKRAKQATFGMKKGFLTKNTKTTNSTKDAIPHFHNERKKPLITELNSAENKSEQECSSTSSKANAESSIHLPEVQGRLSSHLESAQSEWASPAFLESLSKHPTLAKGWNDPKYLVALESMKTHPKETMEKLQSHEPEILQWLMEFAGVMGDHFLTLNEESSALAGEEAKKEEEPKKLMREIGPLEEKAMRAVKENIHIQQQRHEQLDNEVQQILSNDFIRSILLDPQMQQILQDCSNDGGNGKLRYYMEHDDFGPKLRVLMKAGLIKVA